MAHSTLGLMVAAFDASPSEFAVLASDGTILAVNQAWRRFGDENGAGALCGVGANYLQVTERSAATGDDSAETASAALTAVFDDRAAKARMDYACHSPQQQHWFRLGAERLPGRHEVLVTHDEITEHVREGLQLLNQRPPSPEEASWRSSLRVALAGAPASAISSNRCTGPRARPGGVRPGHA